MTPRREEDRLEGEMRPRGASDGRPPVLAARVIGALAAELGKCRRDVRGGGLRGSRRFIAVRDFLVMFAWRIEAEVELFL